MPDPAGNKQTDSLFYFLTASGGHISGAKSLSTS